MISQTLVDLVVTDPMRIFMDLDKVYFRRGPVGLRKFIDGLSLVVDQAMNISVFDSAFFLFCNKHRDKLKTLCRDSSGFCLWYKHLDKERFKCPRKNYREIITLSEESFHWLLRGFYINKLQPDKALSYYTGC